MVERKSTADRSASPTNAPSLQYMRTVI